MKKKGPSRQVPPYEMGFVVIRADSREQAHEIARGASAKWVLAPGDDYLVVGVRWAAVVGEDGRTVILSVRNVPEELQRWKTRPLDQWEADPDVDGVEQYYKDGKRTAAGHDGMP